MNNLKLNPQGIDKQIQRMQVKLYNELQIGLIEGYGRVYLIERENKIIPTHFFSESDYRDVLLDDDEDCTFFFVEKPRTSVTTQMESDVEVIFQLNLKKIYPDQPRRDEEARIMIHEVISKCHYFQLKEITKGLKALEGFDHELLDMQPYHFIKFSGAMRYQLNC